MNTGLLIRDAILSAVDAWQDEWEHSESTRLSGTGHCLRQQGYALLGYPKSRVSARGILEMHDGDVHEPDVKFLLREAGYTITKDHSPDCTPAIFRDIRCPCGGYPVSLPLPNGGEATGHPDGEVIGPHLYIPHLLEIKAMSAFRFVNVVKDGVEASCPDYYLQMQGYMACMELAAAVFIAKAKDSSTTGRSLKGQEQDPKLYVEVVEFDPAALERVVERHVTVQEHARRGLLPDREHEKTDWQCRYCDYAKLCWAKP